jgi:hypothetical protein
VINIQKCYVNIQLLFLGNIRKGVDDLFLRDKNVMKNVDIVESM